MTLFTTSGNVSTTAAGTASEQFTVPYRFLSDTDLDVFLAGVKQTLNTNYTVSGAGSQSGGTVTWVGTPTAAATVRIRRNVDSDQQTDYSDSGPFPAETHESALDKLTMLIQQCLLRSISDGAKFDALADIIENLGTPTASDHAATKGYVDAATFLSSGSISAPNDPADNTRGLRANAGALTYEVVLVPTAATGDIAKALIATGADLFDWHDQFTENHLHNSQFLCAQRGTSFNSTTTPANNDDVWLLDRWLLLSDGNDRVDVSQETLTVPIGSFAAIKLDTETVTVGPNAEKFGIAQILEGRDADRLQGKTVSLSFKAWTTAGAEIENIRVGFMEWQGPGVQDVVTSDIVDGANWGAEGVNPLPASNWSYANTPANIALGTTRETVHKIEGVTLSNLLLNFAIFIWIDDKDHIAGDVVYLADIQLEISDIAHDYVPKKASEELAACQRYYWKTFEADTTPAQDVGAGVGALLTLADANGDFRINVRYPRPMFKAPAITTYSPMTASANAGNVTDDTDTAVTLSLGSNTGFLIAPTAVDATDAGDTIGINISADAEL